MTPFLEDLEGELEKKESKRKRIKRGIEFPKEEESKEEFEEVKSGYIKVPRFRFDFQKIINKLLLFSFFLFVLVFSIFVITNFFSKKPPQELNFNIVGPLEVNSLEENVFSLKIDNFSLQELSDVNLSIFLSEGAYFLDSEEKERVFDLGEIKSNTSTEISFNLIFLNEGNKKEKIKAILRYKLKTKPYIFEDSKEFSILVKNSPLTLVAFLPEEIYTLQPFESKISILNSSFENLNDINIKITPPQEFEFLESQPPSENMEWNFIEIKPKEKKEISFLGSFKNSPLFPFFDAKVSFSWRGKSFSLSPQTFKLSVKENPIKIEIVSNPQSESVNLGSSISYTLKIKNKGNIVLRENQVKVTFSDLFDIKSVRFGKNAYFSSIDNAIYFNGRYEPKLLEIKPGDEVNLNFSARLFNSYPILGEKNKNFISKVFIEFKTPSIPPQVKSFYTNEFVIKLEDTKKIIGKFEIDSFLVYKDKLIENTGPFPLEKEIPTTLTLHFKIKTLGEDFKDFYISGKLPPYVNFTGKVAGDALGENFSYDTKTGEFSYFISSLPANLGYTEKEIDLAFQIVVLSPANLDPRYLELIPSFGYKVTSVFTNTNFTGSTQSINASEIIYELK